MTKFERDDDAGFLAIVGELRRWIKELTIPIITPMPTGPYFQGSPQEKQEEKAVQIEQEQGTW